MLGAHPGAALHRVGRHGLASLTAAPGIPTILHGLMLSGPYQVPAVKEDVYGVYTNTTPVDAYRGAGRPEATFMLERMLDLLAHKIGVDPVEVRKRNLIPPFDNGHDVVTGLRYDSGNYQAALDKALTHVGYENLRREQAAAREKGRYLGIGVSTYVEICGLGPSQVAGAVGFQGGLWESAIVRVHPSGKVNVFIGASPHGQGEETTFAQIVADELGFGVADVKIVHGDTDNTPMGWGTYGSRTTAVGGAALAVATRKIKEKARLLASHLLEAAVEDMDYADGKFFVKGSPDRFKTIQDIALMANVAWNLPQGMEAGLEASSFYDPPNFTFPFGAHVARRGSRGGDGEGRAEALRRSGRLRAADQPGDRRRPGARRRRPGRGPGTLGRSGLCRQRPTPHWFAGRLRHPARRYVARASRCCRP